MKRIFHLALKGYAFLLSLIVLIYVNYLASKVSFEIPEILFQLWNIIPLSFLAILGLTIYHISKKKNKKPLKINLAIVMSTILILFVLGETIIVPIQRSRAID